MIKNKNFVLNLLTVIFVSGFISFDSEPPVFDKSKLIGSYTGDCTILLGLKSEVVSDFPVEFKQKDAQSLYLIIGNETTYASTGFSAMKIASGFKDYGSYAGFNLEGFNDTFGIEQIPNFIEKNFTFPWNMKSMTLNLTVDSKNPPKYIVSSKNLTFTYTGMIEIKGSASGQSSTSSIKYTFNLNKK